MAAIPELGSREIRGWVGQSNFEKGWQYARDGAVFDGKRQGMVLKGQCEGSSGGPYRAWVKFGRKGIEEADCSCPVGDGGRCKHVAALLLTYGEKAGEFEEAKDLDAVLAGKSKEELVALIKRMVAVEPDLEELASIPLPGAGKAGRTEDYARQAAAVFRRAGDGWGVEREIARGLEEICKVGDGFAEAGEFGGAAAVY